jgi:hypothetical protein
MARRKSTKRRSRRTPKLNLINAGTGLIVANAVTNGMFNANLMDFFTGRLAGKYVAGADGSGRITLPEFFTGLNIAKSYGDGTLGWVLADNFKKNGFAMVSTVVLTPLIANVAKKVLRKPVLTPTNRLLKTVGLSNVVV